MKTRNPYSNTKKRKAALAFLAARGITQPRALYPCVRVFLDDVKKDGSKFSVTYEGGRVRRLGIVR